MARPPWNRIRLGRSIGSIPQRTNGREGKCRKRANQMVVAAQTEPVSKEEPTGEPTKMGMPMCHADNVYHGRQHHRSNKTTWCPGGGVGMSNLRGILRKDPGSGPV